MLAFYVSLCSQMNLSRVLGRYNEDVVAQGCAYVVFCGHKACLISVLSLSLGFTFTTYTTMFLD